MNIDEVALHIDFLVIKLESINNDVQNILKQVVSQNTNSVSKFYDVMEKEKETINSIKKEFDSIYNALSKDEKAWLTNDIHIFKQRYNELKMNLKNLKEELDIQSNII